MAATATLENNVLWLRVYDRGECFAIELNSIAALVLSSDLLNAAIAMQQREPLEPPLEERVAQKHSGNVEAATQLCNRNRFSAAG